MEFDNLLVWWLFFRKWWRWRCPKGLLSSWASKRRVTGGWSPWVGPWVGCVFLTGVSCFHLARKDWKEKISGKGMLKPLAGWWFSFNPLQNMTPSVGIIIPNIWKVIKFHGSSHHQPAVEVGIFHSVVEPAVSRSFGVHWASGLIRGNMANML